MKISLSEIAHGRLDMLLDEARRVKIPCSIVIELHCGPGGELRDIHEQVRREGVGRAMMDSVR